MLFLYRLVLCLFRYLHLAYGNLRLFYQRWRHPDPATYATDYQRHAERHAHLCIPQASYLWLHVNSLGEMNGAQGILRAMLEGQFGEGPILVTTQTRTGHQRLISLRQEFERQNLSVASLHHAYAPLDAWGLWQRFYAHTRPRLALVMEAERWPCMYAFLHQHQVPIILMNARLSERSVQRYRKPLIRSLFKRMGNELTLVLAQSQKDQIRMIEGGWPSKIIRVAGNLKGDIAPKSEDIDWGKAFQAQHPRYIWIAASTWPKEHEAAIQAHQALLKMMPSALLILVPRHLKPDPRGMSLDENKHTYALGESNPKLLVPKSSLQILQGPQEASSLPSVAPETQILVVLAQGVLMRYYAASHLAYIGGSLPEASAHQGKSIGGHSLYEPATLGLPMLTGTDHSNHPELLKELLDCGAVRTVSDSAQWCDELCRLSQNTDERQAMQSAALEYIQHNQGSLKRHIQATQEILGLRHP